MSQAITDPEQERAALTQAQADREQELNDLRDIMSTAGGRRFMWRMFSKCKIYAHFNQMNAELYKDAGRREIGIWLIEEIQQADQKVWLQIQQEYLNDEMRKRRQGL